MTFSAFCLDEHSSYGESDSFFFFPSQRGGGDDPFKGRRDKSESEAADYGRRNNLSSFVGI